MEQRLLFAGNSKEKLKDKDTQKNSIFLQYVTYELAKIQ